MKSKVLANVFRNAALAAAVLSWFLVPHFLRGRYFWYAMIGLTVCEAVIFWLTRVHNSACIPLGKTEQEEIRGLDLALQIGSGISFFVLFFLIMASTNHRYTILTGCILWTAILCCITVALSLYMSWTDCPEIFHTKRLLGIHAAMFLCIFLFTFDAWRFAGSVILRRTAIIANLTIVLGAYCMSILKPGRGNQCELYWGMSVLMAALLFLCLNVQLDTSPGIYEEYTVIETGGYHDSAVCRFEDGTTFDYSFCPLEVGDTSYMHICPGWFQEPYWPLG